ncbi:LOW QUALITY PROTEIN: uncharacterized protein [Amphiura filiformis]|uniref:LOW QUALITY PROTEIN: uncharacterized protein n=1 Tax=Amphiura filiformis TaxID=82378 RepID=UPI003B216A79
MEEKSEKRRRENAGTGKKMTNKNFEEIAGQIATISPTHRNVSGYALITRHNVYHKTIPELKAEMDKKVQLLEEKLLLLEIHDRKRNLLVYGVEEEKMRHKMVMLDVWHHNYSCSEEQLERGVVMTSCHRLPQSRHARCDSDGKLPPRPVIVRFGFDSDRAFFGNLNNMKRGCKLRVLDDLPPEMKRERGRLASIAYNIRKEQHQSTKIVVAGTKVSLQYKPRNRPDLDWKTYKDSN